MSENKEFIGLVHQAASAVNMAGAGDNSDLQNLQSIFDKISAELDELSELPEKVHDEALDATQSAAKLIEVLVQEDVKDTNSSLNILSDTVEALQEMADQIAAIAQGEDVKVDFPKIKTGKSKTKKAAKNKKTAKARKTTKKKQTEVEPEVKSQPAPQVQADPEPQAKENQPEDWAETAVQEQTEVAAVKEESTPSECIIPEDDAPMVLDFIAEAAEHIEAAEAGLLELENTPEDTEAINTIFRGFHTIKGMAGFLNLTDIGSLAHAAENLLDLSRQGKLKLVDSNMDVVFESVDMLKKMSIDLQQAIESSSPIASQADLPEILTRISACAEGKPIEPSEPKSAPEPEQTQQSPAEQPQAEQSAEPEANTADQPQPEKEETETAPQNNDDTQEKAKALEQEQIKQQASAKTKQIPDEKIKVSTNRLDELVNMAGELVIAQSMVSQQANRELGDDNPLCTKISHQGKIVRELQELSMLMRMVPIQGVFGKMARLVRDLSRKSGKAINFVTQGEDTELDRNVVDQISDPLVHMVRNSIDHGIEASAEDRQAAGKEPNGLVQLRAFHQAGNIIIEIEDDGRGLDKDKILAKAIKNGVVDPGQDLTDAEIYKLIFHAGLSTAEKITSISGRGVGMDVVKKNIEALRGKIEISSQLGKGTVFTIRLPLTLAIIEGQVIRIGNQKYIIPVLSIERCLRPSKEQLTTVQTRGEMAHVQGELLPVVRLYRQFGVEPDTEDPTDASLVVVEEDGKKGALMVDELLDQQQTVIKSLGESFGEIKGVSGGAIMGDGRVSLILDIPGLLELASN